MQYQVRTFHAVTPGLIEKLRSLLITFYLFCLGIETTYTLILADDLRQPPEKFAAAPESRSPTTIRQYAFTVNLGYNGHLGAGIICPL